MNKDQLKTLLLDICCGDTVQRHNKLITYFVKNNIKYDIITDVKRYNTTDIILPSTTDPIIVLTAHYDVYHKSLGYNDNGSGILAVLLALKELPSNVEVVFTDREELGGSGVDTYLDYCTKIIMCNINVDTVGLTGMLYADNTNITTINDILHDCKQGIFPFSDGSIFDEYSIPTVTLCSGPIDCSFDQGISYLFKSIHNGPLDNNIELIDYDSIIQAKNKIIEIVNRINTSGV